MSRGDGWLTPKSLGRYALYKPPLFYWLSAVAVKLKGFNPLAVRLPSILAGAGVCALVFAWVRREASAVAAWRRWRCCWRIICFSRSAGSD